MTTETRPFDAATMRPEQPKYEGSTVEEFDNSLLAKRTQERLNTMLERTANARRAEMIRTNESLELLWENERWGSASIARTKQGETAERASEKPSYMPNLLRQVVYPLNYLYDGSSKRSMKNDADSETFKQALWDWEEEGHLDARMGELDRLVRVHGTVWVDVSWAPSVSCDELWKEALKEREVSFIEGEDGIRLRFLPPHRFEVLPRRDDPSQAAAVIIFPWIDEYAAASEIRSGEISITTLGWQEGIYYDSEVIARTKGFKLDTSSMREHKLGMIPGFVVRNEIGSRKFWTPGIGGMNVQKDLWDMAQLWREYLFTTLCARGQLWSNEDVSSDSIGPDIVMKVANGGTLGAVSTGVNLAEFRKTVDSTQTSWARSNNLPASLARLDETGGSGNNMSGRAMILSTAELDDDWPTRVRIFRGAEASLHRIAAKILSNIRGKNLEGRLETIEYAKVLPKLTHAELLLQVSFEYDKGLIPAEEALRRLHPDQDQSTIDDWIARAKQSNPLTAQVNGVPNDAPQHKQLPPSDSPGTNDDSPASGPGDKPNASDT